ncbi:MAG TPA: uroporphyrinogen-III synthase [Caldithrix sp.]|nr:uroporphyrinogen-III synthase [Bacteroidales bacterium]HES59550.1 uroporphyrinogen-III synthase [Caldithrix sp.]
MKIKKILVSQPQPDSEKSPYYELAEKNNVKIDFRPFSHVLGISCKDFRRQRIDILAHTAVIFNSKTAIDHFFRICGEMRISVPDVMKYFCVSEKVAFYLQKYIIYRKRKIFHGNGLVGDLMELIMKHPDERYLLPLSDLQNEELTVLLDKQKVKYSKAILYKNVSLDLSDLSILNYDLLVFFSPSSFKSLLKNFPEFQQNEIKIGSFGRSTAKAILEAGLRLDLQAPRPEAPSMIAALEQYIREQNKNCKK